MESKPNTDSIKSKTETNLDFIPSKSLNSDDNHTPVDNDQEIEKSRGVRRIENVKLAMEDTKFGTTMKWMFGISILVCAWVYSLDSSTTYNYSVYATSQFNNHSMISTLGIATSIIAAVMKPILGRFSDLTSRPVTYIIVLVLYVLGYIIVASSRTISAYIIGEVFISVGSAGLDFLNDVIVGDLTPLKWRGFMGSMLSTPFIINTWFSGLIVDAILASNWRWGYGMFAIIMPVSLIPAIVIMMVYDRKAQKLGMVGVASSKHDKRTNTINKDYFNLIKTSLVEIDAFGLVLLGFGWSLLLLPFSLYQQANDGWRNPSMIAMMVVGGVLLMFFVAYEILWCPHPCMPRRVVFNRTFICAIIIDFIYTLAGALRSTYFSSFVWIVKNWSNQNWTYFNNTLTLSLCVFGVVAGIYQRITRRYKNLQIFGLAIKCVGMGLLVRNKGALANTVSLVWVQLLVGMGGAFSVVGSRVASQASVPHQDLSLVIGLLQLWSKIGSGIGSAIAGPIWSSKMPHNLRKFMPDSVTDLEIMEYFGNLSSLRKFDFNDPIRQGAIRAYSETTYYLFVPALGISFIPLIAACFQTNFWLGDTQNAIEQQHGKDPTKSGSSNSDNMNRFTGEEPKNWKDKIAAFYSQPLGGRN